MVSLISYKIRDNKFKEVVSMMKKDVYLSVSEAAEYLHCTKEDIKRLVQEKKLVPYKMVPNDIRFKLSMREVNSLKST